jgi:hypothetical protein
MNRLKQRFETEAGRVLNDRLERFRQTLEAALPSLGSPLQLPEDIFPRTDAEAPLEAVRSVLEEIARGGRQREILTAILSGASACYARVAIFILRNNTLVGWAGKGISTSGPEEQGLPAHITLPAHGDHLLARALESLSFEVSGPNGPGFVLTEALGGVVPGRAGAAPLIVRGRPVVLLYGDTATSSAQPAEVAFDVIGRVGGLALAALSPAARRSRVGVVAAVSESGVMGVAATAGYPAPTSPDVRECGHRWKAEALSAASPTPPEDAEMQALLSDLDGMPRRDSADDGQHPDERRMQADARRFASLLVSELLLYNEEAVILGRRNHDLAQRLAREIEKSRQAFAARVPPGLRSVAGYLEDEMVRVLADGDASLLRR